MSDLSNDELSDVLITNVASSQSSNRKLDLYDDVVVISDSDSDIAEDSTTAGSEKQSISPSSGNQKCNSTSAIGSSNLLVDCVLSSSSDDSSGEQDTPKLEDDRSLNIKNDLNLVVSI